MHVWGMVTDEVVHLGGLIDGGSDRLTDIGTSVLGQARREDIWRGVDADRFRNAAREVRDLLNDVAEQLEQQARVLEEHVMEQDAASARDNLLADPATPSEGGGGTEMQSGVVMDLTGGAPAPTAGGAEPDQGQPRENRGDDGDAPPANLPADEEAARREWDAMHPDGPTWDEMMAQYREGAPDRPDFEWDDDFPFESKKGEETLGDRASWARWEAMLRGGQAARPGLDDALAFYAHYRSAEGTPMEFDYEEAYIEDESVRANVDAQIRQSQYAAQAMAAEGRDDFSFTGPSAGESYYPTTENWQKTIGGYQQWSSGDVTVDDQGNARMVVTVHAEDRYNFNANNQDIATSEPDDANGRFSELGWAQGFDSSGEVVRVVEWNVNSPDQVTVTTP